MANRNIEHIIQSGTWEIEPMIGLSYLSQYWQDLDFLESGGTLELLDYAGRRAALLPSVIKSGGGAKSVIVLESGRGALSSQAIPEGSIARIQVTGAMRMEDGLSSYGIRSIAQDIRTAAANPKISAILLEINSGGGETSAGTELQNAITDARESGTRVGVYFQAMASAALRGTLTAEFLMASGGSALTGSIGTYMSVDNEVIEHIRARFTNYYAAQSSLKNTESESLMMGDAKPLIEMLTRSNQYFIDEVLALRKLKGSKELQAQAVSGKTLMAAEAVEIGLIDRIGTFDQAVRILSSKEEKTFGGSLRGFNNYNSDTMKIEDVKGFMNGLIKGLNTRLGLNLSADADADAVLAALEEQETLSARLEALQEQSAQEAKEIWAKFEALQADNDKAIKALETQVTAANEQLVEMRAGFKPSGAEGQGANVLDTKKFETPEVKFGSKTVK